VPPCASNFTGGQVGVDSTSADEAKPRPTGVHPIALRAHRQSRSAGPVTTILQGPRPGQHAARPHPSLVGCRAAADVTR
jgi:hypothetical protein